MRRGALFPALAVALLLPGVVAPLQAEEEPDSEALRQQLEALNRDNTSLDEQNAELRKRIAELERQTRELAPQAMKPQATSAEESDSSSNYWLAALFAAVVAVLAGWRLLTRRRSS
ncbi:MAG TPA: hypothetical protein VGE00_10735 [Gammaproteobacteria bacterium]